MNNIHLYEYIKMPKQTLKPPIAKRTRHYVPFGKHKSEKGNGIRILLKNCWINISGCVVMTVLKKY